MAIKEIRVCDYPGVGKDHPSTTTVSVRVAEEKLQIDLCEKHLAPFAAALKTVGMSTTGGTARRSSSRRKKSTKAKPSLVKGALGAEYTTAQARAWLVENGHEVGKVGRLTKEQVEAFSAAN